MRLCKLPPSICKPSEYRDTVTHPAIPYRLALPCRWWPGGLWCPAQWLWSAPRLAFQWWGFRLGGGWAWSGGR